MAYLMADHAQKTFLPLSVEDYIDPDDQVRAYDAFVEALDFAELGIPLTPGGNADEYYPKMLMKILVFLGGFYPAILGIALWGIGMGRRNP